MTITSFSTLVGDSVITSYHVTCTPFGSLQLDTTNVHYDPPRQVTLVFSRVVAHHFYDVSSASVLFDIEAMPIDALFDRIPGGITAYFQQFYASSYRNERPDGEQLHAFFRDHAIQGYHIHSSCGLGGWILAGDMTWTDSAQD